ncbi:hypothetical protein EYZ11_006616 [Aspergillus tanneri]|uniref:Uncharacterized protein n=1 Tax=Aspergillus tanneri TaxID=1220188 RepID=A0A4S3JHG4_9EURO|nr:hypothetical protein EYZ11_006616 [Aspergillus tanneri]
MASDSAPSWSDAERRKLAHQLLIELLSYQFASPVQWIDTQRALLEHDPPIQRVVEIGPSRVLANMAEKTATGATASRDQAYAVNRQFLSSAGNLNEIYYEYGDPVEQETPLPPTSTPQPSIPQPSPTSTSLQATPTAPSTFPTAIPDTPLTAGDIVLSLVAQKLKKPFDQVPMDMSIRDLSGGKSTLQNELIGDLEAELGHLPDSSENTPLQGLAALPFSGQLGKLMTGLIARLVSSKMPAGFNQQTIRQHLHTCWGLESQRQTAVLCYATTMEPASRLADASAAATFLDTVVSRYAGVSKINLTPASVSSGASSGAITMVDASALQAATRENQMALRKIHTVLGRFLPETDQRMDPAESERQTKQLESQLEHWTAEFGGQMQMGTSPIFDPHKARRYDSWWNWVRVDLLALVQRLDPRKTSHSDLEEEIHMILNRWTPSCSMIVNFVSAARGLNLQDLFHRPNPHSRDATFRFRGPALAPKTIVDPTGEIRYSEVVRRSLGSLNERNYASIIAQGADHAMPFCHLRSRHGPGWQYHQAWTDRFLESLARGATSGLSFQDRVVVVTGAGSGSIGADVVQGLLQGGAQVIVTTSRAVSTTAEFYSSMYRMHGSRGSSLVVLPFNQGSKQDCEALIEHIYTSRDGYGGDIDILLPFAAVRQAGQIEGGLDETTELAHRLMMVNLLRLLGAIKENKSRRRINTRPTTVVLPLSPNHGTFGGDGLYSESKIGLETLFNRFYSERWAPYLAVCGAVIGWTRGTGLMASNNILADAVEAHNALTFTAAEMAFNILAFLAEPHLVAACEEQPILADFSGNLSGIRDLRSILFSARREVQDQSRLRKALSAENARQQELLNGPPEAPSAPVSRRRRSNLQVGYPPLPGFPTVTNGLPSLHGMIDLRKTVVVVGYSELGPWGSSRTRWEMESSGKFSLEGYLEMAWMMGLVEPFTGDVEGKPYVGWVDGKTKQPVHDDEIGERYGQYIHDHAGIRFIEPELLNGYDPERKEFLHEVVVDEDLPAFEASKDTADALKLRFGDKVQIKKGAHFLVPKAVPFTRKVAGLLPTGWNPTRYGIPDEIVAQVDPITLYVLCCVCQAMLSAGIQDPFEIYRYIHVSELANCIGTGVGGLVSMRGIYGERYLDRPVQSDILQESYLNAMGAWTNMLLLGSSGPIKSPVGTCATAVESLDAGCESILLGKVKMAVVGGTDDFQEEMSYEFANMKATSSTVDELSKGRLPKEMSRPSTTSRSGFTESAGCGIQIITTAELALEMGLPIYSIVAHTQMAGDRIGRSVPAPGQGVLTAARESPDARNQSPLLDLEYRRQQLEETREQIQKERTVRLQEMKHHTGDDIERQLQEVETITSCKIRDAQSLWGMDLRRQLPQLSPLRAALAVWGLRIDDIEVATLHGTSTKANDLNEATVIQMQMTHLGRSKGNPLFTISQKYLTGHPKGAAGAWMFNGGLQVLQTGLVPGNRNADNIDQTLRPHDHLLYPPQSIQTTGVKAFMLTSFGFGQKGGLALAVAPRYLFSALTEDQFEKYRVRTLERQQKGNQEFIRGIRQKSLFQAKENSAWKKDDEVTVFLDPLARVGPSEYSFQMDNLHPEQINPGSAFQIIMINRVEQD